MKHESLVPELRFPEFNKNWFKKSLDELMTFKNGLNASKEDYGFGYKFINVLDIIENDFITHDVIIGSVNASEEEFNKNIVEYGDILFQRSSETREEVGQANVYLDKQQPATFGGFVIRGKKIADYNPIFMNFLLKTSRSRKEITSKSGGSTRYNVGQGTLSEVTIYTTENEEQQKIASFLTAIDKRVKLLEKKKFKLEQYKKGVMQQLFNQDIRFKDDDGNAFPDWEEKNLDDMLEMIVDNRGKTPPLSESGIPLIEINGIGSKKVNYKKVSKYVSKSTFDTWFRKYLEDGDILFSTVGQTAICSSYDKSKIAAIAQNIVGLRFNKQHSDFMYYLLTEKKNNHKFKRIEMGAVQPSVKVSQMIYIKFSIPVYEEQLKISDFLLSVDNLIDGVQNKIDKTTDFKKGLLQKMFV